MINKPVMLITGARKGIGKYLAEYYSKNEYQVIGCSRGLIDFKLDNYLHFCLDVTEESSVKKMFTEIRNKYGRLDVLINNAGVNYAQSPLLLVPYESASKTVEVNLLGTFLLSREAIKIMKKKSFGRIVNLGSMAVKHEVKGEAIYTASKAGIEGFSRVFAREMADFNISVNCIAPGPIKTDLIKGVSKKQIEKIISNQIFQKHFTPDNVCDLVEILISDRAKTLSGQVFHIGGV